MPRRIPAWETEQESFAARCPRPDYARIVLEVCLCADRLADSMGRHSWHGERREALLALRKLENTRPPDLSDAEREPYRATARSASDEYIVTARDIKISGIYAHKNIVTTIGHASPRAASYHRIRPTKYHPPPGAMPQKHIGGCRTGE